MRRPLFLDWLEAPRADKSMHVLRGGAWTCFGYDELAARALGASVQLRDGGVETGDVVAIADEAPEDFVCSLFGALHAGATVSVLPPATSHPEEAFARSRAAGASLVIAGPHADTTPWSAAGIPIRRLDGRPASWSPPAMDAEVAVLQFTSGSTARPRAILVAVEPEAGVDPKRVVVALRRHLGGGVTVEVEVRSIPRTMSDKPRRRELWRQESEERALGTVA